MGAAHLFPIAAPLLLAYELPAPEGARPGMEPGAQGREVEVKNLKRVVAVSLVMLGSLANADGPGRELSCFETADGGQYSCSPAPGGGRGNGGGGGTSGNGCHPYTITRCTDRVEGPFPPKIIRECTTEVKKCD